MDEQQRQQLTKDLQNAVQGLIDEREVIFYLCGIIKAMQEFRRNVIGLPADVIKSRMTLSFPTIHGDFSETVNALASLFSGDIYTVATTLELLKRRGTNETIQSE